MLLRVLLCLSIYAFLPEVFCSLIHEDRVYYNWQLIRIQGFSVQVLETPKEARVSTMNREVLIAGIEQMTIKELYEGADPQKAGWPVLK